LSEQDDQVRYDVGGWISGPCLSPLNQPLGMTPEEATSLFRLRCVWGDRYQIAYSAGVWHGGRLGDFGKLGLTASTAEELRELIGADYQQWQAESRKRA
jgi:hypothetical protein